MIKGAKFTIRTVFFIAILFMSIHKEAKAQTYPPVFLMLNSPIGYQLAYDYNTLTLRNQFDANISFIFINGGYNYNGYYGSSMFLGVGAASIIQLQFGHNFKDNYNLIRLRSDIPLHLFTSKTFSPLRFLSVGVFFDHAYDTPIRKNMFGLSVSLNLGSFVGIKGEIKAKKINSN